MGMMGLRAVAPVVNGQEALKLPRAVAPVVNEHLMGNGQGPLKSSTKGVGLCSVHVHVCEMSQELLHQW